MSIAHKVNGTWQKTAGMPPVDSVLSSTSQNPLENRQIYAALADKITASVSNLVNYYKKSETYTQAEVRQLIGAISTLSIKVVTSLPTTDISATTIYWVGPDATTGKYDQYIYADNAWVKTGDTSVNLGDYVTTDALELAIADFLTEDDVRAILASYYTKTEVDTLLNGKQDSLTFDNVPTENSTNVVKSGGVYSAVDNVYKVMGENGAKNLIPYPWAKPYIQQNDITWTDNGDGTITANGTATADAQFAPYARYGINNRDYWFLPNGKYILSDGHGGTNSTYFTQVGVTINGTYSMLARNSNGDNVEFTVNGDDNFSDGAYIQLQIIIRSGVTVDNMVFKPMIRLAEDTDSIYQPYAKTNQQLTEDKAEQTEVNDIVNVYGAKNLLQYPYYSTTKIVSGVTITDNGDGTLTLDGTATARISYDMTATALYNLLEIGKKYLISFKTSDDTIDSNSWALRIYCKKDNTTVLSTTDSRGPDVAFTVPEETVGANVQFIIVNGTVLSNVVIKPMIRLASITDDTYQPYAMTNKELTEHHTTVAKTFTQNSADVATYLRNANTSSYIAFGYSYNRTMITVNAIFTIKASGNALYKSDGTTATSGNENWELIKIPNFPYSKAIPDGPLSGLLFLNTTDLKDLYCRKSGNDLIFTIGATDYANFVGKGIRLSATIMLK